jgi:hypothetical protein
MGEIPPSSDCPQAKTGDMHNLWTNVWTGAGHNGHEPP